MLSIYFQPNLKSTEYKNMFIKNNDLYLLHIIFFTVFVLCFLYTFSMLPYGRFYNAINGNFGLMFSYLYIFSYLIFDFMYYPNLLMSTFNSSTVAYINLQKYIIYCDEFNSRVCLLKDYCKSKYGFFSKFVFKNFNILMVNCTKVTNLFKKFFVKVSTKHVIIFLLSFFLLSFLFYYWYVITICEFFFS